MAEDFNHIFAGKAFRRPVNGNYYFIDFLLAFRVNYPAVNKRVCCGLYDGITVVSGIVSWVPFLDDDG